MTCLKFRRSWIVAAAVSAPFALWLLAVALAPTEWARARIEAEIAKATAQSVALDRVSIGPTGRVTLRGLRIATNGNSADPWLSARRATLDLSLLQVLGGRCRTAEVGLEGVELRVRRRMDGSFEFADLLRDAPVEPSPGGSESAGDFSTGVNVAIRDTAVTIIDEPANCRFEVSGVNGRATWSDFAATVEELSGLLNGGSFEFAAKLSRGAEPTFEAEARLRNVPLSSGLHELAYLVPIAAGATESVDGRLGLRIALKGRGFAGAGFRETLRGYGEILLDPVNLDGSYLLRELEPFGRLPRAERVGKIHSNFEIADGKVSTENLTMSVAGVPIVLAGFTDFDGRVDYRSRSELMRTRLPRAAREILGELDVDPAKLASFRIEGTIDNARVTLDHGDVANAARRVLDDKTKMREIKNRLLDKVLR